MCLGVVSLLCIVSVMITLLYNFDIGKGNDQNTHNAQQ